MVSPQHADVDGKVWTNNQDTHYMYRLDVDDRAVREPGAVQGPARQADLCLRHADRSAEQRLSAGIRRHEHRAARCQDRHGHDSTRRRSSIRARGAAGSTTRTGCGSPNMAATPSALFDPKTATIKEYPLPDQVGPPLRRRAEQGCHGGLDRLDDDRSGRRVSTPRPATSPSTCCRVRPTSGASSCEDAGPRTVLWVGSNHGASIVKVEPLD